MVKAFALIYGMAACILFGATAIYAVGFIANLIVPKSIDSGAAGPWPQALLIDIGLFAVFALQHSVMARQGFKRWWTRFIPGCIERATYVLAASLAAASGLLFFGVEQMVGCIREYLIKFSFGL